MGEKERVLVLGWKWTRFLGLVLKWRSSLGEARVGARRVERKVVSGLVNPLGLVRTELVVEAFGNRGRTATLSGWGCRSLAVGGIDSAAGAGISMSELVLLLVSERSSMRDGDEDEAWLSET